METFLVIALGLIAAYFGWRYRRLKVSVGQLSELIANDALPAAPSELPESISGEPAAFALGRSMIDAMTETFLNRDLEARNRRFLEALLNEIEDAIFVLGEGLEIQFSNRAAQLLFPSDQIHLGRSLMQVCLDHRIVDAVELAIEGDGKIKEEIQRRGSGDEDGRNERIYLIEAEPLSALGDSGGAWLLIRDVTLQFETEQIRRDFVANASHELRTPLSIINGYLEMLDDEGETPDPEVARRCFGTMRKHSERISRIVEDMLTISKLESDSTETLNRESFDISECIADVIGHLQPVIDENKAGIKVVVPDDKKEREFEGDRFYWDQVLFNLIENSLKQNPQPGLKVKVKVASEKGRYQVEVSDNGVGIPGADVPHIFKRFFRVQKDHGKAVKGTGLGLSIVKRAVEAHHGTISVRSEPGRETTFTISVPKPVGE